MVEHNQVNERSSKWKKDITLNLVTMNYQNAKNENKQTKQTNKPKYDYLKKYYLLPFPVCNNYLSYQVKRVNFSYYC